MEWILCDAIRRHFAHDNKGRSGVLIRAVTRALHQRDLLDWQKRQTKWKRELPAGAELGLTAQDGGLNEAEVPSAPDAEIFAALQHDVLAGGYRLIDWRGYRGFQPGENVVELFVMGALVPEAIAASKLLLDRGVYANVTVVTSPDLLCGELARKTGYQHLQQTLGVSGRLHLRPAGGGSGPLGPGDAVDLAGRRVPIVSVHDGEVGLLDNLGSVVGVPQLAKAVVKFSKSGTPAHIYRYHGLHAEGIAETCGQALAQVALETVQLHPAALALLRQQANAQTGDWRELWPNPV
jgi:pyruvate dehydrogenase E1 component